MCEEQCLWNTCPQGEKHILLKALQHINVAASLTGPTSDGK
jgi:hypothetical protein